MISANVHTIEALDKALTLRDKAHRNPINNTSVIQLANQAGFETYWLSNQKPLGVNETSITLIAQAAKFKHFLTTHDSYNEIYDEALLPALDEVLKNKAKAKLIFIHLMGTHAAYNKRFPSYFQSFDIAPLSKFNLTERAKNRINDYDTAVKYNDSIV